MFEAGGFDPTVINGGVMNAYGSNARIGGGAWMVVEADESDGTMLRLPSTLAVITNLDPEHLEHYGDFDALRAAFARYLDALPFYGVGIVCADDAETRALAEKSDRRILTYGLESDADVAAQNIVEEAGGQRFEIKHAGGVIADMHLPLLGRHNLQNALAAAAAGLTLGIEAEKIRDALAGFSGVARRFTHVGSWRGVEIFDDYAHHPVEIAATLRAARGLTEGRVVGVVQPHRYSRLARLFVEFCECMGDADLALILPVYAAGEAPIEGYDADALVEDSEHANVRCVSDMGALARAVREEAVAGDVVILMGAGDVSQMAHALPEYLMEEAS